MTCSVLLSVIGVLLVISCASSQSCNKTISVHVTSNRTLLTLPVVNEVTLWTNQTDPSWTTSFNDDTVNSANYIINTTNGTHWYALTLPDNTVYNVTIRFSESVVSCSDITLDVLLSSRSFTCIPVSSCSNNKDLYINTITWKKAYYMDSDMDNENEYEDLYSGVYSDDSTLLDIKGTTNGNSRISITADNSTNGTMIENATLTFEEVTELLAGYYIAVSENVEVLYQFTVYYGPVLVNHLEESSAIVTSGTDNYDDYYCVYRSFPNAIVTWTIERDGSVSNVNSYSEFNLHNVTVTNRNAMAPNMSLEFDYSWTVFGGLFISEVQPSHSGIIACTGTNGYTTTSASRRLRVRSPLRPLWPILGIIASFTITAVFILGGYVVDKIRGEEKQSLEQDEINGQHASHNLNEPLLEDSQCLGEYGAFRPLSINSFNEEDIPKENYRRVSSTKEFLPLEQK